MPALRHIAVHVEEPHSGKFVWVLTERNDADWSLLDKATSAEHTYKEAMAKGLLALQLLVDDLDVGPQAQAQDDQPAETSKPRPSETRREEAPAKGRFFGFGPAK